MPIDPKIWGWKVARYRKWVQRRDTHANQQSGKGFAAAVARYYLELSRDARQVAEDGRRDAKVYWRDSNDTDTYMRVVAPLGYQYTIKVKAGDPDRHWFQWFETDPWFDLGYFNERTFRYQDTN